MQLQSKPVEENFFYLKGCGLQPFVSIFLHTSCSYKDKDILAASSLTSCVDWKSISIILQQNFEKCFRATAHNAKVTK